MQNTVGSAAMLFLAPLTPLYSLAAVIKRRELPFAWVSFAISCVPLGLILVGVGVALFCK